MHEIEIDITVCDLMRMTLSVVQHFFQYHKHHISKRSLYSTILIQSIKCKIQLETKVTL